MSKVMQFKIEEEIEIIENEKVIDIVTPEFTFDVEIIPDGDNGEWREKCSIDWDNEIYPEKYNVYIGKMRDKLIDKFFSMQYDEMFNFGK